jgi:hypothetical protein
MPRRTLRDFNEENILSGHDHGGRYGRGSEHEYGSGAGYIGGTRYGESNFGRQPPNDRDEAWYDGERAEERESRRRYQADLERTDIPYGRGSYDRGMYDQGWQGSARSEMQHGSRSGEYQFGGNDTRNTRSTNYYRPGGDDLGVYGSDRHSSQQFQTGPYVGKGPKGYQRKDERILEDVCESLSADPHVDATNIEVEVNGGEVTLRGTVQDRQMKRRAEDRAEEVRGVKDVHNELRSGAIGAVHVREGSGDADNSSSQNAKEKRQTNDDQGRSRTRNAH